MKPKRGYYSLIQFCPDVSRLEVVNVGVILFCPEAEFLDARTSANNRRAETLVGRGNLERAALNAAKQSIERRLEVDRESFKNIEDLRKFIDTRGNWLKLTDSRPVKVFDPPVDLEKLYEELVGGVSLKKKKMQVKQLFPSLNATFEKLHREGRAQLDLKVKVPVMERSINVPFAYQNGTLNLIKPHQFSQQKRSSIDAAIRLATEGNLLKRHGIKQATMEQATNARLIVVSSFGETCSPEIAGRVKSLFSEYDVQNVTSDEVDEFVARVEHEATK